MRPQVANRALSRGLVGVPASALQVLWAGVMYTCNMPALVHVSCAVWHFVVGTGSVVGHAMLVPWLLLSRFSAGGSGFRHMSGQGVGVSLEA